MEKVSSQESGSHAGLHEVMDEVIQRERLLLRPEVRARRDAVLELLHPNFLEFGASGNTWDRASIAEALQNEAPGGITVHDMNSVMLADNVVLLTYTAISSGRTTLRSSVWVHGPGAGWLLRFHQGTRTAP